MQPFTSPFQHSQVSGAGAGAVPQGHQYPVGVGGNMQHEAGYVGMPPADFKAWGFDGTTAQLGMQLGHSAVAAGQDYVQKNVRTKKKYKKN